MAGDCCVLSVRLDHSYITPSKAKGTYQKWEGGVHVADDGYDMAVAVMNSQELWLPA